MATAAELLAAACESGVSCLGELDLLRIIAQGASTGGSSGGGGGTLSTDGTFAANSDLLYPSQKAAKTYIDTSVAAALTTADSLYVKKSGDTMTGALLLPNGAVGAPSLSHAADANTGLWFPAADEISLATSGADRLHILSTGNVGIGTTSPATTLDVSGTVRSTSQTVPTSGTGAEVYYDATNAGLRGFDRTGAAYKPVSLNDNVFIAGGLSGFVGLGTNTASAKLNITPSASGTNYFRIDHSDGSPRLQVGVIPGSPTYVGLWPGNIVPSGANYFLQSDGTSTYINGGSVLVLGIGNSQQWQIASPGHFLAGTDNTYDIGASGASRPRNVYVAGTIHGDYLNANTAIYFGALGYIVPSADGVFRLTDTAGTSFNRLQFGGTTASFPSIKRNGTGIDFRLADDSAYADITANRIIANAPIRLKAYTVATLPAGTAGDTAYVTDSLAPAFLVIVAGGGAVVTPVFYNGTNWVTV